MKNLYLYYSDDDRDDREIFEAAGKELGIDVVIFENANSMLEAMKRPPHPSIVFLDLDMVGINGFEALRLIRQWKGYEDLPVIIYSTSANPRDVKTAFDLGANLYVSKPMSRLGVQNSIKAAVSRDWRNLPPLSPKEFLYKTPVKKERH